METRFMAASFCENKHQQSSLSIHYTAGLSGLEETPNCFAVLENRNVLRLSGIEIEWAIFATSATTKDFW